MRVKVELTTYCRMGRVKRPERPEYFRKELGRLSNGFSSNGVVNMKNDVVEVTTHGRFLIRALCKVFDNFDNGQYKITGP